MRQGDAALDHGPRKLEHIGCGDARRLEQREVGRARDGFDGARLGGGRAEITPRDICGPARVVPHRLDVRNGHSRIGQREDDFGRAEQGVGEVRRCLHRVRARDGERGLVGHEAAQFLSRGNAGGPVARHQRRSHDEVHIVRVIAQPIDTHRHLVRSQVCFIHRHSGLVVAERVEITADAVIDVARHVHEVARAGNGATQTVGVRLRALRPVGGLDSMDVIVNGAGMIGIPGKHALQSRHDRRALRVRLSSARLPVVPWTEIHDRFRVQHRDVVVLRELRRDVGHDGGIGCIQLCPVRLRVLNISRRQGRNQRLLAWACLGGEGPRLLHCGEGRRHRFFRHRQVDVGPEHQRLAPEAHRAVGIELLRLTECALRLLMIEGIGQPQSLVEIDLRRCARSRDFV